MVPFPGRAGDLVTAAASSAPGNVWAFTARPGGASQALRWNGRRWAAVARYGQAVGDAAVLGRLDVWVFGQPGADQVLARSATDVWAVGAGHCQDERGPFYLLHFNGSRWRLADQSARYGEPLQVVPDGSGGLWIPAVAGFPGTFAMLHYTGGRLSRAVLPLPASRLTVGAVAHVAGSRVTFGGGESHPAGQAGTKQPAVILRYRG